MASDRKPSRKTSTRRAFVKQLAAASAATLAAPHIVTAAKTDSVLPILGQGEHKYECNHYWALLPDKYTWQTTHNVAVDSQGLIYIIHQGKLDQPNHPTIFVFDEAGKFVRAFGHEFAGGGHGLEVRREGSDEFVYLTAYHEQRSFAKLTLTGETLWRKYAPAQSGVYADGEDAPQPLTEKYRGGRNRFHPTNFAFHPDGGFYLADGYGSYRIHRFDKDANYVSTFGKPSDKTDADGTFDLPHGLCIDDRRWSRTISTPVEVAPPDVVATPSIVVADRLNHRLQWFTLDGEHLRTQTGFLLPANCDVQNDLLLVPELLGRVTLLGGDNAVVATLGDDSERIIISRDGDDVKFNPTLRGTESEWIDGKFVHPHDACFDSSGNIYVAEWVVRGRITKLKKLG